MKRGPRRSAEAAVAADAAGTAAVVAVDAAVVAVDAAGTAVEGAADAAAVAGAAEIAATAVTAGKQAFLDLSTQRPGRTLNSFRKVQSGSCVLNCIRRASYFPTPEPSNPVVNLGRRDGCA